MSGGAVLRVLRALACAVAWASMLGQSSGQSNGRTSFGEIEFAPHIAGRVRVSVEPTWAGTAGGGFGWVTVGIQNNHDAPHEMEILVEESYTREQGFRVQSTLRLAPAASRTVLLPLLTGIRGARVQVTVDGDPMLTMADYFSPASSGSFGCSSLMLTDTEARADAWQDAVHALGEAHGMRHREQRTHRDGKWVTESQHPFQDPVLRDPAAVPRDWRLLSGFDLVVIDGRTRIDAELQATIADYLETGGAVVLLGVDGLVAGGALRDVIGGAPSGDTAIGVHGFGRWLAIADDVAAAPTAAVASAETVAWLARLGNRESKGTVSGPIPAAFAPIFGLTGVGEVPLGWIFTILLAFALLVGPINYFYWRRRRRLAMLLVTVPVAGFVVTALVLAFGLLAHGLGIRGAVDSLTLLDQRNHRAVAWTARHLFAGMAPSGLEPAASTYVFSPNVFDHRHRGGMATHMQSIELAADGSQRRLAGSLLPARYETQIESAQIGTTRHRLRFRERADGRVEVLMGPELQLAGEAASIVILAPDGRWFVAGSDGLASPQPDARAVAERLLRTSFEASDPQWAQQTDTLAALVPGSYVARVAADPAIDTLGLTVEWQLRRHVVRGVFGPEDWSRD